MPQLPSGRHIGFGYDSLKSLISDFRKGDNVDEFLSLIEFKDLESYIDILFFKDVSKSDIPHTSKNQYHPQGIEPYSSGFNLNTIKLEIGNWPTSDAQAYYDFISSDQMQEWLEEMLTHIKSVKNEFFHLCDDCLLDYKNLTFNANSDIELNFTPLVCIVWLDEHPGHVPDSGIHDNCRHSIIMLSNARKSLWKKGEVNPALLLTWKVAQKTIPDWPGFKRLSISEKLLEETGTCEEKYEHMTAQFEAYNRGEY